MTSRLVTLALLAAALLLWLRRERATFRRGTLAELHGYIENAHRALIRDDYMQVSELLLDMHRIIQAEQER